MIEEFLVSSVTESIIGAFKSGNKLLRKIFWSILATFSIAILLAMVPDLFNGNRDLFNALAVILATIAVFQILFVIIYYNTTAKIKQKERFYEIEKRALEQPKESLNAWDLSRAKLELYLNRNLTQVSWIFILILLVMFVGFGIIIYGIIKVYEGPSSFTPSIVVTISGIIVEFIAATFLVIYKSTMQQAKDYVDVLERINAVGMAVQILDTIDSTETELKEKTKSELVKELLLLYRK